MPLFWFCLAAIFGIITASFLHLPTTHWLCLAIIAFIGSVCEKYFSNDYKHPLISRALFRIPFSLLLFAFLLGGLRFQTAIPDESPNNLLRFANETPITVIGIVSSDPIKTTKLTTAIIKVDTARLDGDNLMISGNLSVLLPSGFNLHYGDRVQLTGVLKRTFDSGALPISSWLARKKVLGKMAFPEIKMISYNNGRRVKTFIYRLRNHAYETIYNLMPFPESTILSGILLGKEDGIPEYLKESYRSSGTIHIIVISGFNISIIGLTVSKLFRRFLNWRWAIAASSGAILLYTILAGVDPPVVRAAIMGITSLPAYYIGRRVIGIHSLTLAATAMLIINPFLLWDASFQLSFLATLSLLTMVDPINNLIIKRLERVFSPQTTNWIMPVLTILTSTLAVSVVVFPILFQFDAQLSLISLPANFLISPLQPIIMWTGGLVVLFGIFIPVLGSFFGLLSWPFIAFCNQVALRFSLSKAAVVNLPGSVYWIAMCFSIAILLYASIMQIYSFTSPPNQDTL